MDSLRDRFYADQHAHASLLQPGPGGNAPQTHFRVSDNTTSNATSNASSETQLVGWGGQAFPQNTQGRVLWFGRNRSRQGGLRGARNDQFARNGAEGAALQPRHSNGLIQESLSVEDVVALIQRLNRTDPVPQHVYNAFYSFDSRTMSLLLKDLSRMHLAYRAIEVFDYLRRFDAAHPITNLCDVYTYTAMISMCVHVERALELLDDMRIRNIERNVHTYTALMNVCIKCGKLPQALEVYKDMRAVGCTPNAVTFNTLIDVYGKLGQWENASQVLQVMKAEGVPPVPRTYNTLIIACNTCNQPREALAVYYQMLAEGFPANSTTYNALISAYGKIGQLEKAIEVYHEMAAKSCDRSVITYSSLISACEKAGKWELAMKLFDEMQQEGCVPNTVTYNSLIAACSQGAQWKKAARIFEQMQSQGCTPDVVTYTALISSFERAGQWEMALKAFQQMCVQGCKPDAIVYNAIIDALWETGVAWAQQKALQLFKTAMKQGHFLQQEIDRMSVRAEVNLHAMTAGVAMLSLYTWLQQLRGVVQTQSESALPSKLAIITDKGKVSKEQGNYVIKEAVATMMSFWEAPFRVVQDTPYGGVLEADRRSLALWVCSDGFQAQLTSIFVTSSNTSETNVFAEEEADSNKEHRMETQCQQAFQVVKGFEGTHGLSLQHMGGTYLQTRPVLVDQLLRQGAGLKMKDEVVHDAVLLMDRTVSASQSVPDEVLPLVSAAALSIAVKQGEEEDSQPDVEDFERLTEFSGAALQKMEYNIRMVLNEDTAAISTLRCLRLYFERLGCSFLDACSQQACSGLALLLASESLYDNALLNCRPSVVAAALMYAERRLRGCVPFWPSMLAKLTGYHDMNTPELAMAIRAAQKLRRSLQCASVYREQTCQLTSLSRQPLSLPSTPSLHTPYLTPKGSLSSAAPHPHTTLPTLPVQAPQELPLPQQHTPLGHSPMPQASGAPPSMNPSLNPNLNRGPPGMHRHPPGLMGHMSQPMNTLMAHHSGGQGLQMAHQGSGRMRQQAPAPGWQPMMVGTNTGLGSLSDMDRQLAAIQAGMHAQG